MEPVLPWLEEIIGRNSNIVYYTPPGNMAHQPRTGTNNTRRGSIYAIGLVYAT